MSHVEESTAPVTIRPPRREDLLDVYRLEQACFPSPWPYEAFRSHLDAPAFLLAFVDHDLAGYIVADVVPRFAGKHGHIKDLAVAEEYRRQGVASRLIHAALIRLMVEGAIRVSLEVREDNIAARTLYRRFDFTDERIDQGYYRDGTDAVIMTRRLP